MAEEQVEQQRPSGSLRQVFWVACGVSGLMCFGSLPIAMIVVWGRTFHDPVSVWAMNLGPSSLLAFLTFLLFALLTPKGATGEIMPRDMWVGAVLAIWSIALLSLVL